MCWTLCFNKTKIVDDIEDTYILSITYVYWWYTNQMVLDLHDWSRPTGQQPQQAIAEPVQNNGLLISKCKHEPNQSRLCVGGLGKAVTDAQRSSTNIEMNLFRRTYYASLNRTRYIGRNILPFLFDTQFTARCGMTCRPADLCRAPQHASIGRNLYTTANCESRRAQGKRVS